MKVFDMPKYREFIEQFISELERLAATDIREIKFPDVLYTVPNRGGKGSLIFGEKAARCLAELSRLAVGRSDHQGLIDPQPVYRELLELIMTRFVTENNEITDKECDRVIATAIKKVAMRKRGSVHYFPCHLFNGIETTAFAIGPVKFSRRADVLDLLKPTLCKYLETAKSHSPILERAPDLEQDLRQYWSSFEWIAEAQIPNSDPETSQIKAKKLVDSSVNCLRLILGERNSRHIRVGDPSFPKAQTSHLWVDDKGSANITTSIRWRLPHFPEKWLETVLDSDGQYYEHLMAVALEASSLPRSPHPHLALRFLDAAYWFAQGVTEESDGAAIVNYVTAIERVLTTKKEKDQTATIKARGPLLVPPFPGETKADVIKRFARAYATRSDLVHGSVSPFEPMLPKRRSDIAVLTRLTLLGALSFFGTKGLRGTKLTENDLDRAYDESVAESEA